GRNLSGITVYRERERETALGDEEEEVEAENQFQRLPDDLVLNIFDKLFDVKCLCRCFVVSKRFSSLIPRVQTLSVDTNILNSNWKSISDFRDEKDNSNNTQDLSFLGKFSEIFVDGLVAFEPLRFLPDLVPFPSALVFHLKQVRCLDLQLFSDFSCDDDSVFKWGAKFTPELDGVTFLYATSLSKTMKSEAEEDGDETENEIAQEEVFRRVKLAMRCLKYAVWWLGVFRHVLAKFPMLESVTITDWKNKGVKLCLGAEKLVEYRNRFHSCERTMAWIQGNVQEIIRAGYEPILQLPILDM
ncbi:F-box protein At4g18380-like, partial [Rhododendron vialii]|uniref:F-box protein At4g18380-like n=1 Tax=Rhododendron vialii TaxID=182163 RepID=UPI00265E3A6F